ncbi:putative RNA-binding protein associated with RNAse of E/G family [Alkalibacillus almallahensis]|nr:putative RNA-binding protein associated with RNAse of E/G family [Alkalibacillus almallahensis]
MWLQQFPLEKHHAVTTMFNANGEIVQWYIDICLGNGIENEVPFMDDLFLDIILLPSGEIIDKDADELEDALSKGIIDKNLYDLAWNETCAIKSLIRTGEFDLIKLSNSHKDFLFSTLK